MKLFVKACLFSIILYAGSCLAVDIGLSPVQEAMTLSLAQSEFEPVKTTNNNYNKSTTGDKSILHAALYSALIPGGGQLYLGKKKTARFFLAIEAATWLGYISFRTYGNWKKDDYISFAASKANAQLEGKSDEFIDLVGFYDNTREYNRLGIATDPDRPYYNTPEFEWEWQNFEDRRLFRDLKNSSRNSYRRSEFMIGLAIVDRVASIIDAIRSARKYNRRIDEPFSSKNEKKWEFSVDPFSKNRQLSLKFYPGF